MLTISPQHTNADRRVVTEFVSHVRREGPIGAYWTDRIFDRESFDTRAACADALEREGFTNLARKLRA